MTNIRSAEKRAHNWRRTETAIGSIAGVCIGETARQIVQYDQVSLMRLAA